MTGFDTIWKFPVPVQDEFSLELPYGAEALSIQVQRDQPVMWVRVNPTAPKETRRFAVHGTGHHVPVDRRRFVGTFQLMQGELVFHLFEVR